MTGIAESAELHRRDFVRQVGAYLAVTGASCAGCKAAFGQPARSRIADEVSPANGLAGATPAYSRFSVQGCALSANSAGLFGRGGIRLLYRSGHHGVDSATYGEQKFLSGYIGNFRPSLAFLDDSEGKNAFAIPHDVTGRGSPHGAVLIGVRLIHDLLTRPGAMTQFSNAWSVAAVLAHEWAHIAQFGNGVRTFDGRVVGLELMADAISGWYLAKKLQIIAATYGPVIWQNGAADQSAAARAVYSLGDTNFTSRNHHGTHHQRFNAFIAGHRLGIQGAAFPQIFYRAMAQFVRH